MRFVCFAALLCLSLAVQYNIDASKKTVEVPSTLFGAFFEEISHAGDGGLYPEKIFNKNFGDDFQTTGWSLKSTKDTYAVMNTDSEFPLNANNTNSLKTEVTTAGSFPIYIDNEGYSQSVFVGKYDIDLYIRYVTKSGKGTATIRVYNHYGIGNGPRGDVEPAIITVKSQDPSDTTYQHVTAVMNFKNEFHCSYTRFEVTPSEAEPFAIYFAYPSILPEANVKKIGDTFIMRKDMYDFVGGIKHGMLRFPGGNFEAGDTFAQATYWKRDIGPHEQRGGHLVPWLPPYYYTAGIGEYEFLLWAEDQHMEPEWVVNCGITLGGDVVSDDDLKWILQDALDAVEFANGNLNTTYGALRAKFGHPEPFNLKYLAVGNEHCLGDKRHANYRKVYPIFQKAIKDKYPYINVVANCDDSQLGSYDIWDEHIYDVNIGNDHYYHLYDNYDRNKAKILITEYSATTWYTPKDDDMENLITAVKEASYLLGVQKNADVIVMASWAPLFYDDRVLPGIGGWPHGMIHFDDRTVYGTPSYYMVQMLAEIKGDYNLYHTETLDTPLDSVRISMNQKEAAKGKQGNSVGLRSLASIDTKTNRIAFRLVNLDEVAYPVTIELDNVEGEIKKVDITTLTAPHKYMMNSVVYPKLVSPVTVQKNVQNNKLVYTVEPLSVTVLNFFPAEL
ncbi:hypothetical protein WA158_005678 [Blastocystis sp. Blastoise]